MRYRFKKEDVFVIKDDDGSLLLRVWLDNKWIEHRYIGCYTKALALKYFQQDFGTYPKDFIPIGTLCLCNHGGIAVMEIELGINDNDHVIVCDNYGNGYKNITKNMIKHDKYGSYFVRYGNKYYLHDFMSCRKV